MDERVDELTLPITGMTCAGCASHVEKALSAVPGVAEASVNLATERASVRFASGSVPVQLLVAAVRDAGYDVQVETVTLRIGGMTCASCVSSVESALAGLVGVVSAGVNLATEKATVAYVPGVVGIEEFRAAVAATGYEVLEASEDAAVEDGGELEERKLQEARFRMWVAWAFTAPIILWMLPEMFFGVMWPNETAFHLGMVLLALPVLFWVGRKTYRGAWAAVTHGHANMDTLIALGTGASLLTGLATFFFPVANYAGVAAMIMAIHLTGRYIEETAKGRASQAIRKLLELGAKTAHILVDGEEIEVPIEQVKVGAVMATKVGKDTFLSQVVKLVEECQTSKVPIQEFADKVTGIFVPIVMGIAVLTLLSWVFLPGLMQSLVQLGTFLPWVNPDVSIITLAIISTVSVLIIACPCALGLATPTALMVGSGMGAENGILIRSGEAIQTMKDIKVVVFDKTGTITKGKPGVTDIIPYNGFDVETVLRVAASAEKGSEHPLGRAMVERAESQTLRLAEPEGFQALRGKGILVTVDGLSVLVGSRRLVAEHGLDPAPLEAEMVRLEKEGKTAMLVAIDRKLAGVVAVADTLKEDSADAIRALHEMGLQTAMITGDNRRTADAIARAVGVDHVLAEVLPDGKVTEVQRLQERFGMVAMVGDGINDAPALTQADVGIAIGTGTDIAIEASDVTLVSGHLSGVVSAIILSRATFRKIEQNLFWAFFYNVVMIPLAVIGWMHPVLAEIAMATSSITVVGNANRLRRVDIRPDYLRDGHIGTQTLERTRRRATAEG